MRKLTTALIAAAVLATTPTVALAYDRDGYKEWRKDQRKAWREDRREARREWRARYRDHYRDGYETRRYREGYGAFYPRHDRPLYRTYPRDYRPAYRYDRRDDWRRDRYYYYGRIDPRYGGYFADRNYRDGSYDRPRYLSYNDRIYRGLDGRYYCRRPDGTTGLIIGALAGGALGNAIAPGESKQLGTVLGAVAGGVAGRAIDRDAVRCR